MFWRLKIQSFFYRFNDILRESNKPPIKQDIRHSSVTHDYIAAEEIQNANWQYFVEQVLEVCNRQEIGETVRKPKANLLMGIVMNIIIAKKT